ncbi:MAG: HAD-IIIA family hydrolase [Bryobacteraceae bacterium]
MDHLVIIAGGQGVRLATVSGDLPKALVPVGDKPVLQHQLELAARFGVRKVTILAGHLASRITDFTGDGSRFGLSVRVLVEDQPMGNAGALLQHLDSLPEQFLAMYGDVMLAVDLQKMAQQHLERNADLTMLVHPNDHPNDSDLIETDAHGWATAIHAYPHPEDRFYNNLVNAGLYVIRREALRGFVEGPAKRDFTKVILRGLLASAARVFAYRSAEYIKDMGTPARLEKVDADWRAGKIQLAAGGARPVVFLDRDGTLNVEKGHLGRHEDLEVFPGVGAALKQLRHAGYALVVLTNQPVIARGEASEEDVAAIHRKLEWELGKDGAFLDAIYYCPHHPDSGFAGERPELKFRCECRKPATGLFEQACRDLPVDVARSWMIGDQAMDIEMARRAGLRSVRVTHGSANAAWPEGTAVPDHIAKSLAEATGLILQASLLESGQGVSVR